MVQLRVIELHVLLLHLVDFAVAILVNVGGQVTTLLVTHLIGFHLEFVVELRDRKVHVY